MIAPWFVYTVIKRGGSLVGDRSIQFPIAEAKSMAAIVEAIPLRESQHVTLEANDFSHTVLRLQ